MGGWRLVYNALEGEEHGIFTEKITARAILKQELTHLTKQLKLTVRLVSPSNQGT